MNESGRVGIRRNGLNSNANKEKASSPTAYLPLVYVSNMVLVNYESART